MTTKKIFLDANIFNDIFDTTRKTYKFSKALFDYALQNNIKIYTSCDIVTNIYYITSKYTSKDIVLKSLNSLKELIYIIPFAKDELSQTIALMQDDKDYDDMEDAIQYILAKQEKCDMIITNDKKFTSKKIRALSSEQFCKQHNIGY